MTFTFNPELQTEEIAEPSFEKTPVVGAPATVGGTNVVPGSTVPSVPLVPMNGPTDRGYGNEIIGGAGSQTLEGTPGSDFINGGKGSDTLSGGAGNDKLLGGRGKDQLFGGSGDDLLFGGHKHDFVVGGDGNDLLVGGKGIDVLVGGDGADTFKLTEGKGFDVIEDFNFYEDMLSFGDPGSMSFFNSDSDLVVMDGNDTLAVISNMAGKEDWLMFG